MRMRKKKHRDERLENCSDLIIQGITEYSKDIKKYLLDQIIHKITNQVDRERNNIVNQIRKEKSNLLELSEIVGKTQIFLRSYINQLKY